MSTTTFLNEVNLGGCGGLAAKIAESPDVAANPVEQLLAALGNCLAVGCAANASIAGIEIEDMRSRLKETSTCTRSSG